MFGLREMEVAMATTVIVMDTLVQFTQFQLVLLLNISFRHGMRKSVRRQWQPRIQVAHIQIKK